MFLFVKDNFQLRLARPREVETKTTQFHPATCVLRAIRLWDRTSLCSSDLPRTRSVDQANLKLILTSLCVLRLNVYINNPGAFCYTVSFWNASVYTLWGWAVWHSSQKKSRGLSECGDAHLSPNTQEGEAGQKGYLCWENLWKLGLLRK